MELDQSQNSQRHTDGFTNAFLGDLYVDDSPQKPKQKRVLNPHRDLS